MTILQPFIIDGGLYINEAELNQRTHDYQGLLVKEKLPRLKYQVL